METKYKALQWDVEVARKRIKPSHSFDTQYWTSAAEVSAISVEMHETEMALALQKWNEDDGNDEKGWWATPEAHRIIDKIKAAHYEKVRYQQHAEKLKQGGPLSRAFQVMFTTSQIGLGVEKAGFGKRARGQQSRFRSSLIKFYDAATTDSKKPKIIRTIHDSATGFESQKETVTAAHLVPHSLGEDMLVALFGTNVEGELSAPYNGLLLHVAVEKALDDGAIAIVPNISDDPSTLEVAAWESVEPKEYKWRIIDSDAETLDDFLEVYTTKEFPNGMRIRDLDGRQLSFKNDMRPRARYLYYLFVVAQLRMGWRWEYRQDPGKALNKQLGKGFWATRGRYLKRSFLLALADEIGHDTKFAENIPIAPGDDNDPDDTGVIGIAKLLQFSKKVGDDDEDDDEDDEDE